MKTALKLPRFGELPTKTLNDMKAIIDLAGRLSGRSYSTSVDDSTPSHIKEPMAEVSRMADRLEAFVKNLIPDYQRITNPPKSEGGES